MKAGQEFFNFTENKPCNAFGTGVIVEYRIIIEVVVIQAVGYLAKDGFEDSEIHQHATFTQVFPSNPEPDPVIVAVQAFALPMIMA